MDTVVSVTLSLLVVAGVFLTVYFIATLAHHDEHGEKEDN